MLSAGKYNTALRMQDIQMQNQAEFYYVIHALISYPKKEINGIKPPASTNEYAVILPETFFITPFSACVCGYFSVYLLQIFSKL